MKKIRNHKLICIVMMIAIMISGICLNEIQANSYFSCKQESSITSPDNTLDEGSIYRTERLSQREVIRSIRQVRTNTRRASSKAESELCFCSFDVDILPQKFHSISAIEERLYYETLRSIAILNYIHKQDGEKV